MVFKALCIMLGLGIVSYDCYIIQKCCEQNQQLALNFSSCISSDGAKGAARYIINDIDTIVISVLLNVVWLIPVLILSFCFTVIRNQYSRKMLPNSYSDACIPASNGSALWSPSTIRLFCWITEPY